MITIIGIGWEKDGYTTAAMRCAQKADRVFLRTALSKPGKAFAAALTSKNVAYATFDGLYESAQSFDELNARICEELVRADKDADGGNIAYCVDGDGASDSSAEALFAAGAEINVIAGAALPRMPATAVLSVSAYDLVSLGLQIDTNAAVCVYGLDNKLLAGQVKEILGAVYGYETAAWLGGERMSVADIDRQADKRYCLTAAVFVPAQRELRREKYCFGDLMRVLDRLTAADGCPWDMAQTHESIRVNLIEEAYEAVDAIDSGDEDAMAEEFGDVLLQAVFHCNIAERNGEFSLADVLSVLCAKLIGRHTHIFGADRAVGADEALKYWDKAKAQEKQYESVGDVLKRLPENFPSLLRAQKLLRKLKKAGHAYGGNDVLLEAVNKLSEQGKDAEVELNAQITRLINEYARCEKSGEPFLW